MTYKEFKTLTKALLIGDVNLTSDDAEIMMLLEYAFQRIADEADALKLLTEPNPDEQIIRNGPGLLYIRMPKLPEFEDDELDLDNELCFAAARFVCSFVSKDKISLHITEASNIIRSYNQKVQSFLESLEANSEFPIRQNQETVVYGNQTYCSRPTNVAIPVDTGGII
jgi:hypothetical protein